MKIGKEYREEVAMKIITKALATTAQP